MTLAQFLEALKTDATVVIKNLADNSTLAELKASGYASLDDAIEARTVAQWSIENASHITVLLNAVDTVTPEETSEQNGGN